MRHVEGMEQKMKSLEEYYEKKKPIFEQKIQKVQEMNRM